MKLFSRKPIITIRGCRCGATMDLEAKLHHSKLYICWDCGRLAHTSNLTGVTHWFMEEDELPRHYQRKPYER